MSISDYPERISISPTYRQKREDDFYLVDRKAFPGKGTEYVRADRIEELEAENRLLRDAVYIDDRTVTMQANDRSKAMTAIRRALDFLNADMPTEAKTALRTTLKELTGGKDE